MQHVPIYEVATISTLEKFTYQPEHVILLVGVWIGLSLVAFGF